MKQKNLLYIFADQWRSQAAGFARDASVQADPVFTPNMDRFAAEGMVFTNAVSTYPLCSPHRAALMTGKYPFCCGMWTNCKIGLDETVMLYPQEVAISDVLKEKGYDTAYIGKWHLDASEQNFSRHPASAAENWDAYTPQGERRHHFDFWYSYGAMDNHLSPHYWHDVPERIQSKKWSPEQETDVALDYLRHRKTEAPFCMFLSWNPPHPPYDQVPQKYFDLYKDWEPVFRDNVPKELRESEDFRKTMRQYFAAISGLDDNFGRILTYLKESGLDNDTILVLSADHGDCMGSQGLMGKNIWYEESITIPLIFRGEDIPAGRCTELLSSIDHMPTLLDLLGVDIPDTVQGISFAAAVHGQPMESEPTAAFLCMFPGMPDLVDAYRQRGMNHKCFGWRGIRTKTTTYVVDNGTHPGIAQKRYLYNNQTDPFQLHPLELSADDTRCIAYDRMLEEYFKQQNDPFLLRF